GTALLEFADQSLRDLQGWIAGSQEGDEALPASLPQPGKRSINPVLRLAGPPVFSPRVSLSSDL
ncbi:MAG TPA: hypothetical protein VEU07_01715, partial [Candidatus Acidoferrum sp.]|nr:hypothetical protein [Candidatus Acidoferrum sp.]